jgi:hypothetical protein
MLASVRFARPEVPACAMTLVAHAGFILHTWGGKLGLETQKSAKIA